MNYIRHLNGFFERLAGDKRMSSYHISLYIALFQHWNANRFSGQFTVSRTEMMDLARIGSANTYARCMKELADWGYIDYAPSSNIHSGSKVTCIRFDTGGDMAGNTAGDTGIKNDTATDTAGNTGTESDTASDTGTNTAGDSGTSGSLENDTGAVTASNTGIKNDTAGCTGSDTATGIDITANTENDTGRSTATSKNESVGIKSDTGTDTASDTLFIKITNRNKLKEEEASEKDSKEKVSEEEEKPGKNHDLKSRIPEFEVIKHFFQHNQSSTDEAQKFYSRYQSSGWKTGDMKTIVSWQALARKWIENNQNNRTDEREFNKIGTGNLSVTVNKNYDEPL